MCEKKKSVSKFRKILVSTVASVCFVAIGTCTSLGVTMAGGRVYNDVYVDTVEWIPEPYQAKEYEENTQSAVVFEEGCEVLYDEGTTDGYQDNGEIRGIQSYDWTLSNNSIRCGKMLNLRAGQRIAITAVIDPADKYVCVGIVQPDGTYRYVYDKECVAHTFTLTQTGTHRVMAKNTSGSTVNILLAYSIS